MHAGCRFWLKQKSKAMLLLVTGVMINCEAQISCSHYRWPASGPATSHKATHCSSLVAQGPLVVLGCTTLHWYKASYGCQRVTLNWMWLQIYVYVCIWTGVGGPGGGPGVTGTGPGGGKAHTSYHFSTFSNFFHLIFALISLSWNWKLKASLTFVRHSLE